jgi:sigma-E factor negative regulatory protein RseA
MNRDSVPASRRRESELLSSLMDGELGSEEAARLLASLRGDAGLRGQWADFHLVGDALRSGEVASVHSTAFCARVAELLALEPTIVAPRAAARLPSALRRYLAPGLAVAASITVLAFVAVPLIRSSAPTTAMQQVAVRPLPAPATAEEATRRAAITVANARQMQQYLAAHRELTAGAAFPRATPYLRAIAEQPDGN